MRYTADPPRGFSELGREARRIDAVRRHHGADERVREGFRERHLGEAGADARRLRRAREPHHASPG